MAQINEFHVKKEGQPTPVGLSISQGSWGLYVMFKDLEGNITRVTIPKVYEFFIRESKLQVERINEDELS